MPLMACSTLNDGEGSGSSKDEVLPAKRLDGLGRPGRVCSKELEDCILGK